MFLSENDWQKIQQRTNSDQLQTAMAQLRTEVATFLAQPLQVQSAPGGYYHDYFCPEHGVELLFDPAAPTAHRCPVDGITITGERFDAAWRWFVNNRLAEGAYRLAILGRLEDNNLYSERVTQILLAYAEQYANYQQVERTVANPGVATYTTLDESVWILPLAWAFSIVRDALSDAEQATIANRLFAPVANHLVTHHFNDIHNFACWHNAAICTIGLLIGRNDLVDFAIHSQYGFDVQLRDGVMDDGLWFEGSFSYHFYTVAALLAQIKATVHRPEMDLRNRPKVREMLVAPILCAYPDGTLPATNDCWYFTGLIDDCCHGVPPAPAFYEVAAAWYDEPLFGRVLHRAYQHGPRDSLDALLYGPDTLPTEGVGSLASVHLPDSGYAILRGRNQPLDEQQYLLLKYGPHGGGHGHPDKLNIIVYAHGERFSPDLGTPGYGLDLFQSWYRQTISHNTVIIDGLSQPEATGQLHHFREEGPFQIADASVSWQEPGPYQNVTMRRVVLVRPSYFVDLFLVECPALRRIDWIYRNMGNLTVVEDSGVPGVVGLKSVSLASGERGDGYEHISESREISMSEDVGMFWQTERGRLQLCMAGVPQTRITIGGVPGNPPSDRHFLVVSSRVAQRTAFVSLFHVVKQSPPTIQVDWRSSDLMETGQLDFTVFVDGEEERWLIEQSTVHEKARQVIGTTEPLFTYCLAS
ncbi:heparinase II/III-family protein [Chloroflexi bacterium TSY]|nr:heparinase II/III-family protein [Chloroflexi bacterium TSY]